MTIEDILADLDTASAERKLMMVAAWVEAEHGLNGPAFLERCIDSETAKGAPSGVWFWRQVAHRFFKLTKRGIGRRVSALN